MKIMVGINLHSNNVLCGLMEETGRRLVHKQLPCNLTRLSSQQPEATMLSVAESEPQDLEIL